MYFSWIFFVNDTATTEIYTYGHTLSLHDALPISLASVNMSPKPLDMVSPSTSVPDRKATPSSTAEQVAIRRRLWALRDLRVVLHIGLSSRTDRKSTRLNSSH